MTSTAKNIETEAWTVQDLIDDLQVMSVDENDGISTDDSNWFRGFGWYYAPVERSPAEWLKAPEDTLQSAVAAWIACHPESVVEDAT